ncbi:MAG TPA: hypothetical protein VHE57_11790 [Mycobacteriales bacterium]|nr:hypothetical protein [Mycobacteriales bacterium]
MTRRHQMAAVAAVVVAAAVVVPLSLRGHAEVGCCDLAGPSHPAARIPRLMLAVDRGGRLFITDLAHHSDDVVISSPLGRSWSPHGQRLSYIAGLNTGDDIGGPATG